MNFLTWLESVDDYHHELFEWLKTQPDVYVHFSNFPEVKINPRPAHYDPIGVFAFPKSYVLSSSFNKNHHFFGMPYITTLSLNPGVNVLNLSKITLPEVQNMFAQLGITPESSADKPGRLLWQELDKIQRSSPHSQKNIGWNKFFSRFNIDAIIDEGDSIIHSNEPSQIVFLSRKAYTVLDTHSTNADTIYRKMAKRIVDHVAKNVFDDGAYKLETKSDSGYPTKKTMKAHGSIGGKPFMVILNYSLQERPYGKKQDALSQMFYGNIYLESPHSSEYAKGTIRVELDRGNLTDQLSSIVKDFKDFHSTANISDNSQGAQQLISNVLEVLRFEGKPEGTTYNKKYDDKTLTINVSPPGKWGDNTYKLYINMKPKDGFGLSGQAEETKENVESNSFLSARKMVINALNYLEKDTYKHYNPNPDKHDWRSYSRYRTGEQLIKWINQLKNKVWRI